MKVSGGAHHCLPGKTSFKLCYVNYVMLGYGYIEESSCIEGLDAREKERTTLQVNSIGTFLSPKLMDER